MARLAGLDVSKWQIRTPPLKGQAFGFARASYASGVDGRYAQHVRAFRAAGLVVGAYHFGVGGAQASIASQVAVFASVAKNADILALDLERNTRVRKKVDGELVWHQLPTMTRAEGRLFIALLRLQLPRKTILLYSSRGTWPGDLGQDANWIADYSAGARVARRPLTRLKWAFWQYTSKPWDRNEFNGDLTALRRLAGQVAPAPAKPKPAPVAGRTIAALKGYIRKLAAVKRPTRAQIAKLAAYRKRLTEYLKRA